MTFSGIPSGSSVFLDANVFVYWFADEPSFGDACTRLIERIEQGDLVGFTSAALLSDVAHRLMTLEACQTFGWPYAGIASKLRRHPNDIRKLVLYRQTIDDILAVGVRVLDNSASHVVTAGNVSYQHGLLSGDALIVAVMQAQGLTMLASNDDDFDRVSGIVRYSPI